MIDTLWTKVTATEHVEFVKWAESVKVDYYSSFAASADGQFLVRISSRDSRIITLASLKWNIINSFNSKEMNKR